MAKKWKKWWYVPVLVSSVLLNIFLLGKPMSQTGVKVISVIDGDTVVLEGKTRVRLRHVDAPEKDKCGYEEATKELDKLTRGKFVRIEETIPDQYGRGMALVYEGNTLLNYEMVASGWVRYHHDISSETESIKQASDLAKSEKRGVYGSCETEINSKNPTCIIKGNIDLGNKSVKRYYTPDCAQYKTAVISEDRGDSWFCSEKEAQDAGFTKAETCK